MAHAIIPESLYYPALGAPHISCAILIDAEIKLVKKGERGFGSLREAYLGLFGTAVEVCIKSLNATRARAAASV